MTGIVPSEQLGRTKAWKPLKVNLDTTLADAARRAIVRSSPSRFHPLVCTDSAGRYVGIVTIERLIERLALEADPLLAGAVPTAARPEDPARVRPGSGHLSGPFG